MIEFLHSNLELCKNFSVSEFFRPEFFRVQQLLMLSSPNQVWLALLLVSGATAFSPAGKTPIYY